jgi:hypothetical protein
MNRILLPALLVFSLLLAACSATATPPPSAPQPASASTQSPDAISGESTSVGNRLATHMDDQGAIIFEITPLNLDQSVDTFEFNVVLTTHSIDLSMDLAATATLSTDTGVIVNSTLWDAPRGGHHVEGKLIFPATKDGQAILDGATKLTLTITNVDAPTRIFEWELK